MNEVRPINGLHHVTAITADAQANLDFYVGFLGLRLIKRSINQGNPGVYHLFYGDEHGSPGSEITFFAYPRLPRGEAGAGMVRRVVWRLGSVAALEFWERRAVDAGLTARLGRESVVLADPDGLENELCVVTGPESVRLSGVHPQIPAGFALQGLHAVRACERTGAEIIGTGLDAVLGFGPGGMARGPTRTGFYLSEPPPVRRPRKGAGTVHHVAWAIANDSFDWWVNHLQQAGVELVEVADRYYFRSIYFHIPSGVLFELATTGPGFTIDEPLETLGTTLSIPPQFASLRDELEATLPSLVDPRDSWPTAAECE